jgi:hypothetical protein
MKKIALLIVCLTGFFAANAQVTVKPGIRAGANFATLTQTEFDTKTDFYAGGLVAIKLSRFYTLQPEITYSRQGAAGPASYVDYYSGETHTISGDVDIDYLSFGIINKFTFNDQFDFHFGPTLDFETSSNIYTDSDADLGLTAGIGYTMPFGLTIEARVKKGLVDVIETSDYVYDSFVDDYNTNFLFQIGLSYTFTAKGTTK